MKLRESKTYLVIITGLALFAMFFGAGNLIFPVMIGVNAGTNVVPAIFGFLLTGVVLPVLGMVAAATSSDGITSIADRIAKVPGLIFTIAIFLSTGMLYAIPRVVTVSFEMSFKPLLPLDAEGNTTYEVLTLLLYSVIFMGLVLLIVMNPKTLLERIGAWLTPALLLLLAVLIITVITTLVRIPALPTPEYADNPLPTGILQGYFTMDAIASLVFGVVIISSLQARGFTTKRQVFGGTALAGVIAGTILAIIYLGLAMLGTRVPKEKVTNGADALAFIATQVFGSAGQIIFGLIALLACLTTAAGLVGASTQFFLTLLPRIGRFPMIMVHIVVSWALANLGLSAILKIVAPINLALYPVAIMIIFISILDIPVPGKLFWTYRLGAWMAAFIAFFEALESTGLSIFAGLKQYLVLLPAGSVQMAWVVPALVMAVVGFAIDTAQGRLRAVDETASAV